MSHKGRNTIWPHPINRTTHPITILLGLFPWNYMKRKRHGAWCMVPCPCSHSPAYPTPPTQTILPVNGICKPKSYQRHHAFFAFFGSLFFLFFADIYIYICLVLIETNILQAISILIMVHEVTHLRDVIAQAPPVLLILWQDEYLQSLNVIIFKMLNDWINYFFYYFKIFK